LRKLPTQAPTRKKNTPKRIIWGKGMKTIIG